MTSVPNLWLGINQHQFLSFCLCRCESVCVKRSNSGFSIVFSRIYLCQAYKVKARLDLKQSILSIRLHRKWFLPGTQNIIIRVTLPTVQKTQGNNVLKGTLFRIFILDQELSKPVRCMLITRCPAQLGHQPLTAAS